MLEKVAFYQREGREREVNKIEGCWSREALCILVAESEEFVEESSKEGT
jgi:hypothetical protein